MGHGKEVADQHRGQPRGRARFRARHPAGQSRGLRFQDQHRREIQRRGVSIQRRPQRRRHESRQRAVEKLFCAQPSRRRICRGQFQDRQTEKRRFRQNERTERHAHRVRAGRRDFQGQRVQTGIHRAPVAALQLSEHRAEADFENAGAGRAESFPVAPRPDGFGDGRPGERRQRADLCAAALRGQDAGILFHAQQFALRRDVLFLRQRPIHQRRRHAFERVPRRFAESGQRIRQRQIRRRRRARMHGRRGGDPVERPGV